MYVSIKINAFILPRRIFATEAFELYRRGFIDEIFLLMAKDWRVDQLNENEDYEELTPDELDDEDFLIDFAEATLELWAKR
jgi:hypothetical protein